MKILVNCYGFIGDILFASSLATKLVEKYGRNTYIIYSIPLLQPKLLLEQNPFINRVVTHSTTITDGVDMTINIPTVDQNYPATIQMQAAAGIENQSLEFDVWTIPKYDQIIEQEFNTIRETVGDLKIVAYQVDWAWRAYQCTPETLAQGIGAPHRNTKWIIEQLDQDYFLIPIGFDRHKPSSHLDAQDPDAFARTASLLKHVDWFIGAEGGLSNLAAGVHRRCIITTDFIYQNYGPTGRLKRCNPPMMGPKIYYPYDGHVHLDPCITDEEIPIKIKELINANKAEEDAKAIKIS